MHRILCIGGCKDGEVIEVAGSEAPAYFSFDKPEPSKQLYIKYDYKLVEVVRRTAGTYSISRYFFYVEMSCLSGVEHLINIVLG